MCLISRIVMVFLIAPVVLTATSTVQAQDFDFPPNISCDGFDFPLDGSEDWVLPVNEMRMALPLRARLYSTDEFGVDHIVTGADLGEFPPVVQVDYWYTNPETGESDWADFEEAIDGDPDTVHETLGNEFVYMPVSREWHYNLLARNYKAGGAYRITMEPSGPYQISPTCTVTFYRDIDWNQKP